MMKSTNIKKVPDLLRGIFNDDKSVFYFLTELLFYMYLFDYLTGFFVLKKRDERFC